MKSARVPALLALLVGAACNTIDRTQPAHGEITSLIVIAADSLWAAVGDRVEDALEPRIFTVRDEKAFEATHVSPLSEEWIDLRRFRQVLAIGIVGDGWMEPLLDADALTAPPEIVERSDVWARGQTVTAIVLPQAGSEQALLALLPELGQLLDDRFREHVTSRMFLSDANTALRDSLAAQAGFSVLLPNIYRPDVMDGLYIFRSTTEVGGQLSRAILVTWRDGLVAPAPDEVLAWRASLVPSVYSAGQTVDSTRLEVRPLPQRPEGSLEVHGIWTNPDLSVPAAGPFIDRVVLCPEQNRTYFLEAWLFAPGRQKYEYMIQFQTILDSFTCGSAG